MKSGTNFGPRINSYISTIFYTKYFDQNSWFAVFFSWVEILGNTNKILVYYLGTMYFLFIFVIVYIFLRKDLNFFFLSTYVQFISSKLQEYEFSFLLGIFF